MVFNPEENIWIAKAIKVAKQATCLRAKCGSVIVKDNTIIGQGYNSPPKELESQRRCTISKDAYDKKVTDKTCCVHAEQRAILDACSKNQGKLKDSTLYFIRLDEKGNPAYAGKPYCTICSKFALDVGISTFVLVHQTGPKAYNTVDYNVLSFQYTE